MQQPIAANCSLIENNQTNFFKVEKLVSFKALLDH